MLPARLSVTVSPVSSVMVVDALWTPGSGTSPAWDGFGAAGLWGEGGGCVVRAGVAPSAPPADAGAT
ncbi:hypothetical protein Raf01_73270 [Rugosimonospora africana]|uniref:Uncharacterized protein n=1 Tax=Rugosimonospora africana TaxID=556532 RepID=A0A8J3QXB9_9ACTN|nr:hypothetical protein Raf01_73270 [Rugosimonospora africana]